MAEDASDVGAADEAALELRRRQLIARRRFGSADVLSELHLYQIEVELDRRRQKRTR